MESLAAFCSTEKWICGVLLQGTQAGWWPLNLEPANFSDPLWCAILSNVTSMKRSFLKPHFYSHLFSFIGQFFSIRFNQNNITIATLQTKFPESADHRLLWGWLHGKLPSLCVSQVLINSPARDSLEVIDLIRCNGSYRVSGARGLLSGWCSSQEWRCIACEDKHPREASHADDDNRPFRFNSVKWNKVSKQGLILTDTLVWMASLWDLCQEVAR